ncbi:unnamed protein product [marine sediment metagenome]|uniref:Uncharacterized protein n=1 Tax=marine sediment metagenome TaxID=412755 RepID=X1ECN2_9ZZZZ
MGTPVFMAIFIAPNFNFCNSPFDERVPSGNMPNTFSSRKIFMAFLKASISTFSLSTENAFKFLSIKLTKVFLKTSFLVIKYIFLFNEAAKTAGSK